MGKVLAEPPALSPEVVKLLSFMRGEPVDYGKVYDAREVLLLGISKKQEPKLE